MQEKESLREEQGAVPLTNEHSVQVQKQVTSSFAPDQAVSLEENAMQDNPLPSVTQPQPQKSEHFWDKQIEDVPPGAVAVFLVIMAVIIIVWSIFRVKAML